ncbi:MAG: collagen-like protein [Alistipes sp.]
MMQMIIYSPTGTEILDAPVTKEAIIKYVLMGDYYIELPFNLLEPTTFARGSYITYKGRKFEIMSTVRPEFDNKTGGYKYTLKFEAQQNHMKRFVCFWLGGDNPEAVFHNTTDLESFAALIVANMNKQLGGENWQVGTITVDNPKATKLVSFNGDKCWDILNTIAETFETEWWTEENGDLVSLCFGKLDFGSPEEFRQGNVVKNIPAKKGDDSSYGTRFYVFGSTRNLTSDYGQAPQGGETNHVSEIRLRLPDGQRYIDAIPGLSGSDIVEQVVFFDDIYPKNTETVTSIETVREIIEGQTDKAYVMYCKDTPFRPSDMIKGETLGATFTSGSLMGRDFELSINYKPETWKPEDGFDKKFEIIAQVESSGESQLIIPNESLHPEPGDTFVITGVKLPKERIEEAEKELLKAGESYAAKHSSDTDVYDCETNPVYCQENKKNYDAGQAVRLVDPRFGESGRLSRIQGYEKKLYNEYIATYTVGDNTAYSRIGNIESEVKANLYAQRIGVTESGASIYLITRYDSTAAADYNAYSAKRALWEFANKQFPDTFKGKMTFDDGAQFGGFASGMTGFGGIIDKKGNAEMQSLKLRGFLEVPELRYNRVEISMGDTWYAPSAGIIESVDTTTQTITLKLEEGEIGSPRVGDICMGIFHNLNTSENATADYDDGRGNRRFAGFATCYFRITEELDTTTYKTFKYQLRPVSGAYPTQYHPAASMTFVGYGSFSNEDRQTSRYETRTYQRYLTGVSDWEFTASNIAAQYGDLSNLSVFGINMTGYSAYLNNIYMSGVIHQFTPGGEEVPTIIDRGVWSATETYNRNDDVYWNNGHWRCLVDGTKTEPGKDAEEWVYLGGYGVLETVSIFKKSESEPAKPTELKIPPEGWTTETLPMSDQRPTWMCTGTVVDGEVKSWSAPQRVSGEPGSDGKDGKDYEWIFARTSQYKAPAQPPTAQQDDYIPSSSETSDGQVWTDDAVGPDSDTPYEWASKRVKVNGMWGKFTDPALWAKFSFDGAPGVDGTDVEWIFKRTSSDTAPNTPSGSDEDGYVPSGWTNNPTGPNSERPYEWTCVRYKTGGHWSGYSAASLWAKWSFDGADGVDGEGVEYIFTRTETEDPGTVPDVPDVAEYDNPPAPWTDDPTGVDATYRYEWVSKRNKVEGVWGAFSSPSIWARYSYDGQPGNWTSYVFKNSDTEPAKPTSYDPIPSGWSDAPTGVGIWWMSKATIDASTGKAGAWSTPIRVTGEPGSDGKDGKDYEWIFARTSQYKAPAQPPTAQQDDYIPSSSETSDGQVWTDDAVGPDSDTPYEWASKRVKVNGMWGKFTDPALWAKFSFDGAPGVDGTDVEWIFKRTSSDTAPNTPSGSDEDGYVPSGWTNNPTGPNSERPYEWTCVRYKTGGHWSGYSAASLWAKWSFDGADGVDGEGVEYIFTRTETEDPGTVPDVPDVAEYDNPPAPWTDDPTGVDATYRYEWVSKRNKVEGVWGAFSSPSIWARYSYDGQPGNWTSYVFKNSDTEPAKPTSYDPIPSGWSDAPTGVGIWWMSKATIDASTGKAGAWSTPIRVTGEDGEPGPHTDFKYAKNNSTTTAPALVKTDRTPAGWSDTPPSLSSGEYLWMTQAEIDADDNLLHPTVGWATPVRISGEQGPKGDDGAPGEDGAPGKDGLQGCITRLTEWASGVEYRNDLDLVSNGPRYIDVVTIYANNKQLKFQCGQTHTSSNSNKPTAGSASAYWQQLNDMVPIYTPLLFAENAVINFLQGMEFVVHNSKTDISVNTIIAGLVGGDIPLFVGSNTPSNAPFRVAKDGAFVATKADITGTINASSGTIGGFKIDESSLTATDSFGEMLLSSNLIRFTNDNTKLYLGGNTWPGSTGGALYGPIRAEVSRSAAGGTAGNVGVYINVTGAALSDGTTTAARQSGNHALYIPEGFITGFRLRNVRTSSNRTLTDMDSVVFSTATGEITLTLPSSPKQGQIYFIRKVGSGNVKLKRGNTQHRICTNSNSQNNTEITLDWGKLWIILWDHMNSMWTANWCQY